MGSLMRRLFFVLGVPLLLAPPNSYSFSLFRRVTMPVASCWNELDPTIMTTRRTPRSMMIGILATKDDDAEGDVFKWDGSDEDSIIIRDSEADDIDGSIWEDLETGQPPEWLIMKELLGINVFTYILAALVIFFLSMNYFLGPGWLGSILGVPGTGYFTEVSDSFPDTVDLSSPEFRL